MIDVVDDGRVESGRLCMLRIEYADLCCFFFFSSRRRHTRCSRDWSSDVCSSDLLVVERDPADRISLIDLIQTGPKRLRRLLAGVPTHPSSIAIMSADRLLLCSETMVSILDFTASVFNAEGPILLGINHIPIDCISNGVADTTDKPGYFFQVYK